MRLMMADSRTRTMIRVEISVGLVRERALLSFTLGWEQSIKVTVVLDEEK